MWFFADRILVTLNISDDDDDDEEPLVLQFYCNNILGGASFDTYSHKAEHRPQPP